MKKKRSRHSRHKPPTTARAIDVLIGDEEQIGKEKKAKKKNGERVPNTAGLNYWVGAYDPHESYDGLIYTYISPVDKGASEYPHRMILADHKR